MSTPTQTERDLVRQAAARVEAVRAELANLQTRHAEVSALVEQRRREQRDAAREAEQGGGGDSRRLTRAVAAAQEAAARLDALAELATEKANEVAAAEQALDVANRELHSAERQARVAELAADARRLSDTVKARFESLALAMGELDLVIFTLDQVDRAAAQAVAATSANNVLNANLLAGGAVGIVDANGQQHSVTVPVVVLAPALAAASRGTATLAELIEQRARNDSGAA